MFLAWNQAAGTIFAQTFTDAQTTLARPAARPYLLLFPKNARIARMVRQKAPVSSPEQLQSGRWTK